MDVSLPVGVASFTLRQVKTRPMSRSVGLMSSWLTVVSLFPSCSSSWGGTAGDRVRLHPPHRDQGDPAETGLHWGGKRTLTGAAALPAPAPAPAS